MSALFDIFRLFDVELVVPYPFEFGETPRANESRLSIQDPLHLLSLSRSAFEVSFHCTQTDREITLGIYDLSTQISRIGNLACSYVEGDLP